MLIGREYEQMRLKDAYSSKRPEFVAVYGRRRVGKTYLIRRMFDGRFFFRHTGKAKTGMRGQLDAFRDSLVEAGQKDCLPLKNWKTAFAELKRLIATGGRGRKVVFLDELPWLDTPRSGFVPEFEYFWNDWASARDDVMLIVCGSATSWIVSQIVKNKGGLHNRLTMQLSLQPFTLAECELYARSSGLEFSRRDLAELYMVFGGVPYYWSLVRKGRSVGKVIDSLLFAPGGELELEFDQLYASLFSTPGSYLKIVEALGRVKRGLTREELVQETELTNNGILTRYLRELEQCGFIRKYAVFGNKSKGALYQLVDAYSLFYFRFVQANRRRDPRFWTNSIGTPLHSTWAGLAFERLCLSHLEQIKKALGISGVQASAAAWRHYGDAEHPEGAQIDLLIDRADRLINLCEMRYCENAYSITEARCAELLNRRGIFVAVTGTKRTVHLTMVTACGLKKGPNTGIVQSEVTLDDLFAPIQDPRL